MFGVSVRFHETVLGNWCRNWATDRTVCVRIPEEERQFLLSELFRPVLGPTQRLIQWVPGSLPGEKAAGA